MARKAHKSIKNAGVIAFLLTASGCLLALELITHFEFLLHLAAIPLEILIAVILVERYMERHESRERRRHLMYIKSTMFRSDMRTLFITNFHALKSPALTMTRIKAASLDELRAMQASAASIEYRSVEAMEPVIMEYVKAERVWQAFLERAINNNFEEIFYRMIDILHFLYDVKLFKENNPDKLFILEAEKREPLMRKAEKVLHDGILAFLDYAIELKEKTPAMFDEVMADYEMTELIRGI
ncbi:MAG: hypothetical protein NTZ26_04590 [Candidatus Aminicenantes bacterium]|nr:hypothetical protein [Candidatus Aminicenantes bacterium]